LMYSIYCKMLVILLLNQVTICYAVCPKNRFFCIRDKLIRKHLSGRI